jgi:hypothetical protein
MTENELTVTIRNRKGMQDALSWLSDNGIYHTYSQYVGVGYFGLFNDEPNNLPTEYHIMHKFTFNSATDLFWFKMRWQ